MSELNSYNFMLRTLVSLWMNSLGIEIFMTKTVHEVLWGFKDPLLSKIHNMRPEVDDHFGLMWKVRTGIYLGQGFPNFLGRHPQNNHI